MGPFFHPSMGVQIAFEPSRLADATERGAAVRAVASRERHVLHSTREMVGSLGRLTRPEHRVRILVRDQVNVAGGSLTEARGASSRGRRSSNCGSGRRQRYGSH
jgi:hypothetical protein